VSEQPLSGIRVVEWASGVAAPFCSRLLADYGADVVKVEPPAGDPSRRWGPFPGDAFDPEKSGTFFACNAGKRSLVLDLERAEDRERLRDLLDRADVFVESGDAERMREWGLDYESLAARNPNLVVVSITPFGRTGPYASWKGSNLHAFHLSGTGMRYCGRPGEAPLENGAFAVDVFGAYVAATWAIATVQGRERAGGGQHIDVSCAEVLAALFVGAQNIGGMAQDGIAEKRTGVGMPLAAPATILPCKDGYVWMMALEPGQWNGLRNVMGDPEWARPEMFQDMFARAENADLLYSFLEQWTMEHTKQEIMDLCQENKCPTTALFTVAEVADHPHLAARGFFRAIEHRAMGRVRAPGAPILLPDCPRGPHRPAPLLGEHRDEVLAELERAAPARAARVEPSLPLSGIRVANFGWGYAGPITGQTLALLGAEVYKIESRARIDINRTLPPHGGGVRDPDRSLVNHACWAGNGSVTLDLKNAEARELALQLVSKCDIVVENFGPGVMERLGLGYEVLRSVRPDVVMVSMPAAGLTGPLSEIRTYGMSLSSITGLDSVTGYPGGSPIPMENAFADPVGGILGALSAVLGLGYRDRTGRGQHVDCSQQEGVIHMVAPILMDYVLNGRIAAPVGNRHPLGIAVPHGVFPCAGEDRWIAIATYDDGEWRALVDAMGSPAWAAAPELASLAGRQRHIDAIEAGISEWTRALDARELAERLQRRGVAATPVLGVADLLVDPHFRARGTFVEVEHPLGFRETIYGAYVKTSGAAPPIRTGPMIGQDNERVFRDLMGLSAETYARLVEDRVIF
jgi:benzylsuccinate CoA-transferase BbsF subunit